MFLTSFYYLSKCLLNRHFLLFFSYTMLRKHKFLTQEILKQFRTIWDQAQNPDPIVICKFFDPCSRRTRYATEYDETTRIFFWYVYWSFPERWTFSLDELQSYQWPLGIGIERDAHFTKCPFSQLKQREDL